MAGITGCQRSGGTDWDHSWECLWLDSPVKPAPDAPLLPPQVSATFAASLVTSPAIGAYLSAQYGDSLVALVATVISVADIAFVFFVVPESLPDKMRLTSWGFPISWEQADPFAVS